MAAPFIGTAAVQVKNRRFKSRGLDVMGGIKSDSEAYLKFTERLSDRLNERFTPAQDDEGINGREAITGNFNGLRTVAGYMMTPRSLPVIDNSVITNQLGLAQGFQNRRHEAIFAALHVTLYKQWTPSDVAVARVSSSTFPFFSRDVDYKVNHALHVLENFDTIMTGLLTGEQEQIFSKHKVLVAHALNYRNQVDTITVDNEMFKAKERLVNDFDYAISSGQRGRRFAADKRIIIDQKEIKGHFAMRSRPVYGMAAPINYAYSAVMAGYRSHYLKEFEFTFKHTTREQILGKVNKFAGFRGFDVKQFDESVSSWLIDEWVSRFARDWPSWLVEGMSLLFHAPYFSPDPYGEGDGIWMGNPFNLKDFILKVGLPSGIAPNPDVGKFMMTWAYLVLLDDHFQDVLEFGIDKVLKGEHPRYGLLDMSDDAVILSNSTNFSESLSARIKNHEELSPYFKLEKEESVAFLGNVFFRPDDGPTIDLCPDIRSFFNNKFVPERGADSKMREYWPIGWFESLVHYSDAPGFSDAMVILREEFRRSFGVSPDSIATEALRNVKKIDLPIVSAVDEIVLNDPSKLFYRFEEQDVSPGLFKHFIGKIPKEEIDKRLSKFCRKGTK